MQDRRARENEWSQLMRAAMNGDGAAYQRLLNDLSRVLRATVRRGFGGADLPASDAEDVVQEVVLAIHLKRHTWDQSKPIGPWIMAITRNKMIDEIRRRGRRMKTDRGHAGFPRSRWPRRRDARLRRGPCLEWP